MFSAIFAKGNNFCYLLFAFLDDLSLPTDSRLLILKVKRQSAEESLQQTTVLNIFLSFFRENKT